MKTQNAFLYVGYQTQGNSFRRKKDNGSRRNGTKIGERFSNHRRGYWIAREGDDTGNVNLMEKCPSQARTLRSLSEEKADSSDKQQQKRCRLWSIDSIRRNNTRRFAIFYVRYQT